LKDHANYKVTKNSYQRAGRFPIQTEIHYRPDGTEDWQMGGTKNISCSGVSFNAGELLAVNTALDLSFPLAAEIGSEAGAMVLSRDRIVRT